MALFGDQTAEAVRLSLDRAKATGGGKTAVDARRAINYHDSIKYQADDLYEQMLPLYANREKWLRRPKIVYNLVAGIASAFCTLYHDPVVYDFGEDKRAAALWDEVYGWHSMMADADLYTFLGGTLGDRPIVDKNGKVDFRMYLADQLEYVQDPEDPLLEQQISARWTSGQGMAQTRVAHHWSDTQFAETVDDRLKEGIQPNPYGVIPIIIFRNCEARWDWYGTPAADLTAANLELNAMMTDLNHTVRWQAHGQLVLIGAPPNYQPPIGSDTFISVSNAPNSTGADARYINPGADIGAIINAINQNLDLLFAARRIPKSAVVAVQGDSGISLVAQQASLRDYRKRRIAIFRPLEEKLIALTLKVLNYHKTGKVEEFVPPVINYTELEAPMSDEERLDWDWKLRLNVASAVDVMLALNPGMSEEDARAKIEENRKDKAGDVAAAIQLRRSELSEDAPPDDTARPVSDTGDVVKNVATNAGAPGTGVQQTALNGAQVTALQGIMESLANGSLSQPAAKILIGLAFPLFDKRDINAMVAASPAPQPPPVPNNLPSNDDEDA